MVARPFSQSPSRWGPRGYRVARAYADLRAASEAKGVSLGPLDMMIAAQAVAADAVLVTNDNAFSRVPDPLRTENWDRAG